MRFHQYSAALVAAASLSGAATLEPRAEGEAFTVYEEKGPLKLRDLAVELESYYHKYNHTVPEHVRSRAEAAKKHTTVTANPEKFDATYLVPVHVGGDLLHLVFDSGSSDLWGFSTLMAARERKGHGTYKPKKSKHSKKVGGHHWLIQYADGSAAEGEVYTDHVRVGSITSPKQYFEAATKVTKTFTKNRPEDGILGLGFDKLNTIKPNIKKPTFISRVLPQLQEPLFAAALSRGQKAGAYDIGFVNPKHHKGPVHYTSVDASRGFWSIKSSGFYVGNKKHKAALDLIVDTGTSLMLLQPEVVRAYYKSVPGARVSQGEYFIPCNGKRPDFSIDINGSKRTTPAVNLAYAPAGKLNGKEYCVGGLQEGEKGSFILGDTFLQGQYVVFHRGHSKVGFADKA